MVILEVKGNDRIAIEAFENAEGINPAIMSSRGISGAAEIAQIAIPLTTIGATLLYNLVKEHIRAKRYVKVKYKDFEISGVEEEKIMDFLTYMINEIEKHERKDKEKTKKKNEKEK
ncbi:MAG: Unknown protein [uncultured Sulfurovum sp.]|uniref:Uncharacterized protein n=1 Tax=uncultured Sulfurovum sp. TaxID=269237 RepID=A0A6S6T410_9BACT|nr:MAG: Unknown protein [uncultured Sulfurovum sp.]